MSTKRRPSARTLVVLTIAIFLLSPCYWAAWCYTANNAGLTPAGAYPSRVSPAPFVVVETTSGEARVKGLSGEFEAGQADFFRVILWCAGYESEVTTITLYR